MRLHIAAEGAAGALEGRQQLRNLVEREGAIRGGGVITDEQVEGEGLIGKGGRG